jgi:hypothetical protein
MAKEPTHPTEPLPLPDPGLTFWDGVWIIILTILGVALGIAATILELVWLAILAGICVIVATWWWLFNLIWPWNPEFAALWRDHPIWAFILRLVVYLALAGIAIIVFGLTGWLIVLALAIALLLALLSGIFCVILTYWERFLKWLWSLVEFLWTWVIEKMEEIAVEVETWEQRKIATYRTVERRQCSSWHWSLSWLCLLWVTVKETIVEFVTIVVKVITWAVKLVVTYIYFVVSVIIFVVTLITVFIPKLFLFCWVY